MVGTMRRRWLLRALLIYLAASLLAGVVLGEVALRRGQRPHWTGAPARAAATAAAHGARLDTVRITAADGVPLEGWLFTTGRPTQGTGIVTHGIGGWRDHASPYAAFLLDAGLDRIARYSGLGEAGRWLGRPAAWIGLGYVRLRYGVNLLEADPAAVVGRIHAPILLIHGSADVATPPYHAAALARAQPAATVWLVAGAGHTMSWRAEPERFPRRIVAFLAAHR
jgi:pimeloyl-ACP methyl ester carboxylesterase